MRETREMIINAVMRLALKNKERTHLTITEIATEAGLSRQAIYQKHFKNVAEIFEDIHVTIDEQILKTFEQKVLTLPPSEIYNGIAQYILPLVYQHREWLRVLYSTNIDLKWRRYLHVRYSTITLTYLAKYPPLNSPLSQEKTINLLTDHLLAVISTWLSDDFPMHPEKFTPIFLTLMTRSPRSFFS